VWPIGVLRPQCNTHFARKRATAASSSSAAWSTPRTAPSNSKGRWSSATPRSRPDKRIELSVGIYLGDVVEESDGDLMGDGINIAARLEGVAKPGTICLSEDSYRQEADRRSGHRHFCQRC
jgi:class 3 adenylate cyclase